MADLNTDIEVGDPLPENLNATNEAVNGKVDEVLAELFPAGGGTAGKVLRKASDAAGTHELAEVLTQQQIIDLIQQYGGGGTDGTYGARLWVPDSLTKVPDTTVLSNNNGNLNGNLPEGRMNWVPFYVPNPIRAFPQISANTRPAGAGLMNWGIWRQRSDGTILPGDMMAFEDNVDLTVGGTDPRTFRLSTAVDFEAGVTYFLGAVRHSWTNWASGASGDATKLAFAAANYPLNPLAAQPLGGMYLNGLGDTLHDGARGTGDNQRASAGQSGNGNYYHFDNTGGFNIAVGLYTVGV